MVKKLLKDFDPSQETYEEYLQRKSLERPFNMSDGGRIPFAGGKKVTTGKMAGKYFYYIGKGDNYRKYYADSPAEGEAWVKKNRMRKGYDKAPGKKITMTEKNKGAQKMFGENYNDLKTDKKLTKAQKQKKVYDNLYGQFKTKTDKPGKFKVKTQAAEFSATDQAKIKKVYPEAKFTKRNTYGFPPDHPKYNDVWRFVNERNFKTPYEGGMFKKLPKYAQEELKEAFKEIDFNFDRKIEFSKEGSQFSKYGISTKHPKYSKVATYFDEPKQFRYLFDLKSPEGWMMSQMDKAALQLNTDYKVILQNPNKPISKTNKIIGIETGGKKYNMKTIVNHPDFDNTKKYWNIADKTSRKYLNKFENLSKLLPDGFDPKKIQLNDLLQFIGDKDGVKGLNRAKRAIQIHHEYGVGTRATKNYQLLRQDLNLLANKANNLIKTGDLKKIEKGAAKALIDDSYRLVVDDVRYGPKKVPVTGDIKNIISQAESELKKFTKKDFKTFASQLEKLGCGKAAGGRVLFSEGTPGATLTKCAREGSNKLEKILLKGGANKNEQVLANSILKAGAGLKNMLSLKGFLGPAALAFTAAETAGIVGYNMLAEGKTFKEAVGDNFFNYALGPKLKIDSIEERNKRFRKLSVSEKDMGKIAAFESALGDIDRIENIFTKDQTTKQKLEEAKKFFPAVVDKRQKEADAVRADIQDLMRTGTEQRLMNVDYDAGAKALEEAKKLATIDRLTSKSPQIFGKIFPQAEKSRQQRILDASGSIVNPAHQYQMDNLFMYPYGLASGGRAGLSGGDTSGRPPESGPMSQGLRSLYNNGRKL